MLPICIKVLYHALFINLHQGLISKSMGQQSRQIQEKRIKIMAATFGMKYQSETILEMIRGLVLDFGLYFITLWQSTPYM